MDLSINTTQVDASVALRAYSLYKQAQYKEAIPVLQDILDMEPKNWQARLFLGACFYNTNQPVTAERTFRFVYDGCSDAVLKQKACLAMQVVRSVVEKPKTLPAEFGAMADRVQAPMPSLDSIIG